MGKTSRENKPSISEIKSDQGGVQKPQKSSSELPQNGILLGTTSNAMFLQMIVVVLVSFAVYFKALYNGFVYDDNFEILANPWIQNVKYLSEIFSKSSWDFITDPTLGHTSNYYRPLAHVIRMFNYYVFGLKPWGFHLVNILFHSGNTVLVFMIASRLLREREFSTATTPSPLSSAFLSAPFIAALFFAVHPIHSEAVTWIACVPEVSFTLFFLLSFYFYMRSAMEDKDNTLLNALSIGSFFLAGLCKETALTLPVILIFYDNAFRKTGKRISSYIWRYIPYFIIAGICLALRYNALKGFAPDEMKGLSTYLNVINVFPLFIEYLKDLCFPIDLNLWHTFRPIETLFNATGMLSFAVTVAYLVTVFFAWKKNKTAFFCLILIVVPLLPVFYIKGLSGKPYAERYLYLPSVGFVILIGMFFSWLKKRTSRHSFAIIAVATLLTGLCSIQTIIRSQVWKNNILLFSDTVKKSPEAEDPNGWLGFALMEAGRDDEAIEQFRNTLKLNPNSVRPHIFLANLLLKKGLLKEAISHYQTLLSINPNDFGARQDIADAYMKSGMIDQAKEQYQILGKLNPDAFAACINQGTALAEKGLVKEAITQYERALAINPNSFEAHQNLGSAYGNSGQLDKAIEQFKIAVRLQPNNALCHNLLGIAYERKVAYDKAVEQFKVAAQLAPLEPAYRQNLDHARTLKKSAGKYKKGTDDL